MYPTHLWLPPLQLRKPNLQILPKNQKDNLRVIVVNCQGLRTKKETFATCLENHSPNIVLSTESWLDDKVLTSEMFPHEFSIFRRDRGSRGGGVFVAVRGDIVGTRVTELEILIVN